MKKLLLLLTTLQLSLSLLPAQAILELGSLKNGEGIQDLDLRDFKSSISLPNLLNLLSTEFAFGQMDPRVNKGPLWVNQSLPGDFLLSFSGKTAFPVMTIAPETRFSYAYPDSGRSGFLDLSKDLEGLLSLWNSKPQKCPVNQHE